MKKIFLMFSAVLFTTIAFAQTPIYSNDFTGGSSGWSFTGGNSWGDLFIVNNVYNCSDPTPNNGGGNYLHVAGSDFGTGENCAYAQYSVSGSAGTSLANMTSDFSTVGFSSVTITFDWLCKGSTGGGFFDPMYGAVEYSTNSGSNWIRFTSPQTQYISQTSWTSTTISSDNVPGLLNQAKVRLRFVWVNSGIAVGGTPNPAFAIDNILVTGTSEGTCNLSANANHKDVKCKSGADGTASVSLTGGTSPFTYIWNPSAANTPNISGLLPGTYNVTISDVNGCTATASAEIKEPSEALNASAIAINATCGDSNGAIDVTVIGGTSPYSYAWNVDATGEDLTGLSPDYYFVFVTDANGCPGQADATITNIPGPVLSEIHFNAICGSNNGRINLSVDGGTSPFTFLWSNDATDEDLVDLPPNKYLVDVTDANGCTAGTEVDILQVGGSCIVPENVTVENITSSSAVISWDAQPCANRFRLRYRPINGSTWASIVIWPNTKTISGLTSSTEYEVQVATRCSETITVFTNWSSSQFFTTHQKCVPPSGIAISDIRKNRVTVSWDAVPGAYSYDVAYRKTGTTQWTRRTVLAPIDSRILTGLSANTEYDYEMRTHCDALGRENSGWSDIQTFSTILRMEEGTSASSEHLAIYPNPSKGNFNVVMNSTEVKMGILEISNLLGQIIYTDNVNLVEGLNTFRVNIPGAVTGIYMISFRSADMTFNKKIIVNE